MAMVASLKALDSITSLSFDSSKNILQGTGLSRGSDSVIIQTKSGGLEKIKAGKFPVMFYINNNKDSNQKRHIKNSGNYRHRLLLKRVNGMLSNKNHIDSSSSARGTSNSE